MSQATEFDLKQLLLTQPSFGASDADQIARSMTRDFGQYRALREAVQQLEQQGETRGNIRLGIAYYLLGRYVLAVDSLSANDSDGLGQFYLGRSLFAQEKYDLALAAYDRAAKAGYDNGLVTVRRAEALRYKGEPKQALAALDQLFGAIEQTADYLYQRGATIAAVGGNPTEVTALYQRAVDADPAHPGALFGLALENDRRGNDDTALSLYERSAASFPPHLGTLLNLGLLYEDRNQYEKARQCYQRIMDVRPNEPRARLFMKDASASSEMFYDEDAQKKRDRMNQLLSVPVTDFELSVRSRNCLQKMGVMTLGDLTATTEQELLASKNFGETSLLEIRDMLTSKGLSLGQFAGEKHKMETVFEPQTLSPDEQMLLNRPISDLNLSVRARKCMVRLGVSTIGELVRHTGDELLECKNFGVTSLTEVREKLVTHNLKLRGD